MKRALVIHQNTNEFQTAIFNFANRVTSYSRDQRITAMAASATQFQVSPQTATAKCASLTNAKTPRCRLLELPAELRNEIYQHVFESHICIDLETSGDKRPILRQRLQQRRSLLAACKQIRREGNDFAQELPVIRLYMPVIEERPEELCHPSSLFMFRDLEALAQAGLLQRGPIIFNLGKFLCDELSIRSFEKLHRSVSTFHEETEFLGRSRCGLFFDLQLQNELTARFFCGDQSTRSQKIEQGILFCGDLAVLNDTEEITRDAMENVLWMIFWRKRSFRLRRRK